ncbi:hypothetical protein BaRGS_00018189 [Batillaria attramentaria]|uniref:Uncharacterized protein n=1 Tax=Batillaria attramentaria TaxID=370345 RepID=A0ABD0KTJ3_9CAEN
MHARRSCHDDLKTTNFNKHTFVLESSQSDWRSIPVQLALVKHAAEVGAETLVDGVEDDRKEQHRHGGNDTDLRVLGPVHAVTVVHRRHSKDTIIGHTFFRQVQRCHQCINTACSFGEIRIKLDENTGVTACVETTTVNAD